MKLLKCHIENFGKLSGYDYEFKDGLNTIKENNGYGKTTFANFIKAMFYGMEAKRNTKVLIDRKKYIPWQGGAFGGSVEFELNGKKYKIERFFGKKEAEDVFKLYDLSTNLECDDFSQNIGEEIFNLNKEAYERSTFISGQSIETAMNDSISAKLGNILESENDVNTSEKAIKILEDAIKNYKKTGDRGEINEKKLEKTNLEKKLEQSKIDEKNLQERREKYSSLKQELKEKEEERQNLNKLLTLKIQEETKNAKLENYKILQNNLEEAKKNLEQTETFFKAGTPTDEETDTLIEKSFEIEKYKVEVANFETSTLENEDENNLKKIFDNNRISEEIINDKISDYKSINDIDNQIKVNEEKKSNLANELRALNKQRKLDKTLCIILGILICVGIIVAMYGFANQKMQIATGATIFGILIAIAALIKINTYSKKSQNSKDKDEEEKDIGEYIGKLKEKKYNLQMEVDSFITMYSGKNDIDDVIFELTEIKSQFNKYKDMKNSNDLLIQKQSEITAKLKDLEESMKEYFSKYFPVINQSYVAYAQEIKIKKGLLIQYKQEFETKLRAAEEYKKNNKLDELQNVKSYNMIAINKGEIEEKIKQITLEINNINDEKNYVKNQIELLESNLDSVFDVETRIDELAQKIEEMEEKCKILEKTKKYLETAKEQFSSQYLNRMKQNFMKNLQLINGSELDINLDVNLNVKVNEQGSGKDIGYFSTGYKDLIYICMRLSLIDSLFEKEKPFIILDDPFVNLDESKIKNATDLLKNIAKDYQIIYFICHDSRR